MLRGVARWLKIAVKIAKYTLPPAAVVAGGWFLYQTISRDPGGTISEPLEPARKANALNEIMRQYSSKPWPFDSTAPAKARAVNRHHLDNR